MRVLPAEQETKMQLCSEGRLCLLREPYAKQPTAGMQTNTVPMGSCAVSDVCAAFCGYPVSESKGQPECSTIFESEQRQHSFKCPTHLLQLKAQAQQYCQPDVNAGSSDDAFHELAGQVPTADEPEHTAERLQRHEYVQAMGHTAFADLTQRIEKAYQQVCSAHEPLQQLLPAQCTAYLQADNARPFSLKHAQQQASIVGHMEQSGLLKQMRLKHAVQCTENGFYIEFGAGKGYLTSMLADASDARHFVLLDVRSFRNKAERSLRKIDSMQLQRLRVDIKDFQPGGVQGLQRGITPWVATGKHLCGAATDFTLRCCASSLQNAVQSCQSSHAAVNPQPASAQTAIDQQHASPQPTGSQSAKQPDTADTARSIQNLTDNQQQDRHDQAVVTASVDSIGQQQAAVDEHHEIAGSLDAPRQAGHEQGIQGLAVATCCHHRCSWQHYVGKPLFKQLGFSPDEFEVISWMTGWALCGHETPAGEADQPADEQAAVSQEHNSAEPCLYNAQAAAATSDSVVAENGNSCKQLEHSAQPQHTVLLSRPERIVLGSKCKKLIDKGRELWLTEQGFQVQSVLYVDPKISGENRLLLAVRPSATQDYSSR